MPGPAAWRHPSAPAAAQERCACPARTLPAVLVHPCLGLRTGPTMRRLQVIVSKIGLPPPRDLPWKPKSLPGGHSAV